MRYLRLLAIFARTELQFAAEYRVNLLLDLFEELIIVVTSFGAVLILFTHTGVINGWTLPQMTVLLGVYYILQGANSVLFETSFERFMEHVRLGTLDFILIKPANSQFLASARHVQVAQAGQVVLGLVMIGFGIAQIGVGVGVRQGLAFVVTLACGLALVYCLLLVLSTLAFWFVRVENLLAIFWAFVDAGRFPVDVYPGWLRITLSTIVPIGIAVTVPAQAIAGRLDTLGLVSMVGGTVLVWGFAGWFWKQGLRNYSGASA
ncbi:MAG TPA: ABC-2 family transporter protein [Chloroflexota bacterium]|nr:ABC-2 family transporter protein [Chloroflexota bacterium]